MTPPAMTAAGRRSASPASGHRRALRRERPTVRPRRISGPVRGRAAVAPALGRPAPAARALKLIRSLPEHSLLDRLVRGRAWIPVLGVLLAGIVAMQVEVLKLGTGVGRWMQRASTLQTKNEVLQASVASLADDQRIERLAAGMGMVIPAPTAVSFVPLDRGGSISRALDNIHSPDPTGFIASLPVATTAASTAAQGAVGAATTATTTSTTATGTDTTTTAGGTTGATATPATPPPAVPTAATGAPTSSQSATPPSGPASGTGPQTQSTGAAAVAPAGEGPSTAPSGG